MNNQLVNYVDTFVPDNLINSAFPRALTTGVLVRANQGVLLRGAVLSLCLETEEMVLLGTAAGDEETLTPNCILADPVDTGDAGAVPAVAYRTGHFNRPALIVKSGYTMTLADEEILRNAGILLSDALV